MPEGGGRYRRDPRRLVVVEFEDFTEDVRQAVLAIQAQQHAQRTSNLHLFKGKRVIRGRKSVTRAAGFVQFGLKTDERVLSLLGTATLNRSQVIARGLQHLMAKAG